MLAPETSSSIIPRDKVHLHGDPVRVGQNTEPCDVKQPQVRLIQNNGVIQAIEITCVCGHRIHLDCIS